jgi:CBS domain containing-hemolysin-like protein
VPDDTPLDTALSRFIQTKSHLFLVQDEDEKVVGIITLEDVIEKILNREIDDEFDVE